MERQPDPNRDNDFNYLAGPRFYVDAPWKPDTHVGAATAGLGIFATWPDQGRRNDVFVFAVALTSVRFL